ncbi:tetratricopeptide repeat protein [Oxalobacteraceae bacterium A2-2]
MHTAQDLYIAANRLLAAGDSAGAERLFLHALALQPDHPAARANLGYLKEQSGALDEAERHYRAALELLPEHAQLLRNLGALLLRRKQLAEAEQLARMALRLEPESAGGWSQLGAILASAQREEEAEDCYRRALALAPHHPLARFNYSYLLLRQGRWEAGWPLLEARWEFDRYPDLFRAPHWQGEPLQGRAVAIGLEAGLGDMIQFCRYAALLKERGAARVGLVCHPALARLFATLPGVDEVHPYDGPVPAEGWDVQVRPMQLPGLFGTTPDTVPAPVPYLSADASCAARWRELLCQELGGGLKVGLAWRGNPDFQNDADRSLPSLSTLAPLAAIPGVDYVSLQKGAGEHDPAPDGMALYRPGGRLRDLADTAALLVNLDLVISVDTAVAHLAGALGKPCWLLLPDYRCDWRWLKQRGDTPWYPHTRLFRQQDGDWRSALAAVAQALSAICPATWPPR